MARIVISRRYVVLALFAATSFLLLQDVRALGLEAGVGQRSRPLSLALSAEELSTGTGTVTVDGETQSFTVERCDPYAMDDERRGHKRRLVAFTTTAETGSLFFSFGEDTYEDFERTGINPLMGLTIQKIDLRPAGHRFEGDRNETVSGDWEYLQAPFKRPASTTADKLAPGPSFQVDGSTLTASGTFKSRTTGTDHVVEFSLEGAVCVQRVWSE